MDSATERRFKEKIEKEVTAAKVVLRQMDRAGMFANARPIGTEVQYKSSSIAAIPHNPALVQKTESMKPRSDPLAFQYCKDGMGMSGLNLFAKGAGDPRSPIFDPLPEALRNREFYGKPDATASFYRSNGAFVAQLVQDPVVDAIIEQMEAEKAQPPAETA